LIIIPKTHDSVVEIKDTKNGMKRNKDAQKNNYSEYRTMPVVVILCCGLVIVSIGLYLFITKNSASGFPTRTKFGGMGRPHTINGLGAIIVGVLLLIYPVYVLLKQGFKGK
jgi:hypothetical protein